MRILVTGGLGFIGSNFIRQILGTRKNIKIVNLDKMSYGANPNNIKDVEGDGRYTFVKGDIADRKLISNLINDVDAIINFAAESHVDRSIADPWPFFKSNTEGVLSILESVRYAKRDIKFLQVGSDESYGSITNGSFKEDDRLNPSSPYSASKAAADLFCLAYQRTYGTDIVVTRCTNNFGEYQSPEKLIPKAIIRAKLDLKIPLYGSGENVRDWIYVLDHCEALATILEKGVPGEIYNIAGGNEFKNLEVVNKILEVMGKGEDLIEFVEDRPGHDIRYSLDKSKIKKNLNWTIKYGFIDALQRTVNWYLQSEWWWKTQADERILHPTPWKLKW